LGKAPETAAPVRQLSTCGAKTELNPQPKLHQNCWPIKQRAKEGEQAPAPVLLPAVVATARTELTQTQIVELT